MDDGHIWGELLIIILLVLANGACSLAEIAIVGARKTKLQEMIDAGSRNAVYALRLAEKKEELFHDPGGHHDHQHHHWYVFGRVAGGSFGARAGENPVPAPYAQGVSMVTVMVLVTYFSLIIGELVPKWVAIAIPEKAACAIARPMILLATVCRPLVLFSTWSTKVVVNLIGVKMGGEQPVSEEEIRVLLQQGAELGTFDKEEPEIIDNVFELNDRTAADCMTARPQLTWLDLEDTEEKIWKDMMETTHFRLPVGSGSSMISKAWPTFPKSYGPAPLPGQTAEGIAHRKSTPAALHSGDTHPDETSPLLPHEGRPRSRRHRRVRDIIRPHHTP